VTGISHGQLRHLLRDEAVSVQAVRTGKRSNDPPFAANRNRILELSAITDAVTPPLPGDRPVVVCLDEFASRNPPPCVAIVAAPGRIRVRLAGLVAERHSSVAAPTRR